MASPFDPQCFNNMMLQFKFSLSSASMFVLQQWAHETFTFIASFGSITILAAQTVCRNIVVIFYMIPVGISMASSILVG